MSDVRNSVLYFFEKKKNLIIDSLHSKRLSCQKNFIPMTIYYHFMVTFQKSKLIIFSSCYKLMHHHISIFTGSFLNLFDRSLFQEFIIVLNKKLILSDFCCHSRSDWTMKRTGIEQQDDLYRIEDDFFLLKTSFFPKYPSA